MTLDEALDWIQQVDGRLYQNPKKAEEHDAWVAVVRMPPSTRKSGKSGKVIIGIGSSLEQATFVAEQEWNARFEELSGLH